MRASVAATLRRMDPRARHVCPVCGRDAAPRRAPPAPGDATPRPVQNPSFPFCSPACKVVDLGRWLDGTYRIPEPEPLAVAEPGEEE